MSIPQFDTLEAAFAYYSASASDPSIRDAVRYWHNKTANKIQDDIAARDAGNPYKVQKNVTGFHYTQGYFPSLLDARQFVDAMPDSQSGEAVEIVHTMKVIYTRPPPYRDPSVCHQCGHKLPEGCGGSDRDDFGCMWDQIDKWPTSIKLEYKLKKALGVIKD